AVDDRLGERVGVVERVADVADRPQIEGWILVERRREAARLRRVDVLGQRSPLDEVHRDVELLVDPPDVAHRDDVVVPEPQRGARLLEEVEDLLLALLARFDGAGQLPVVLLPDELEGDEVGEHRVPRLDHHAGAALPHLVEKHVLAEEPARDRPGELHFGGQLVVGELDDAVEVANLRDDGLLLPLDRAEAARAPLALRHDAGDVDGALALGAEPDPLLERRDRVRQLDGAEHRLLDQDLLEPPAGGLAKRLRLVVLVGREEAAFQQQLGQGFVVDVRHGLSLSIAAITSATDPNLRFGSGCIIFLRGWITWVGAFTTIRFGTGMPLSIWSVTTSWELAPE